MKPLKIWAHLDNFFFIVSKGEPKEKCWKIAITIHWFFSIFPLVPPWKLWKKSCLNKLKFWEASQNQKRSICWKFQISISLGTQKSAKNPPTCRQDDQTLFCGMYGYSAKSTIAPWNIPSIINKLLRKQLTHSIWQIRPLCPQSKWNKGKMLLKRPFVAYDYWLPYPHTRAAAIT